jgi:hypothetical protein
MNTHEPFGGHSRRAEPASEPGLKILFFSWSPERCAALERDRFENSDDELAAGRHIGRERGQTQGSE